MLKAFCSLERIKNVETRYVGCVSNINTRYSHDVKVIEDTLKCLCIMFRKVAIGIFNNDNKYYLVIGTNFFRISKEEYDMLDESLVNC